MWLALCQKCVFNGIVLYVSVVRVCVFVCVFVFVSECVLYCIVLAIVVCCVVLQL